MGFFSIKEFESLLEHLENFAITNERRDEETVSHGEIIEELKKNGIIFD